MVLVFCLFGSSVFFSLSCVIITVFNNFWWQFLECELTSSVDQILGLHKIVVFCDDVIASCVASLTDEALSACL